MTHYNTMGLKVWVKLSVFYNNLLLSTDTIQNGGNVALGVTSFLNLVKFQTEFFLENTAKKKNKKAKDCCLKQDLSSHLLFTRKSIYPLSYQVNGD